MTSDRRSIEQLWAPWRLGYVTGQEEAERGADHRIPANRPALPMGADADCFLCRYAAESTDRDNLVVHRGKASFTVLNRYPYNNGHLLVSPIAHKCRLDALTPDEQREIHETVSRMITTLETLIRPQGFNVGLNLGRVAGAGIPGHLHWHILPRWEGDTNFMPTLAGARVIPQSLDALWDLLTEALATPP